MAGILSPPVIRGKDSRSALQISLAERSSALKSPCAGFISRWGFWGMAGLNNSLPTLTRLRHLAKMPCPFGCGLAFGYGVPSVKHMWHWHLAMELKGIEIA